MHKKKLVRITTVPISLEILLKNQLRFMNQYYDVVGIASDQEKLKKIAEEQGIKVHHVEMTRKITILSDLKAVWALYRYFKKEKPFIVHTHTPKAGTLGMIAAKLARVPHRLHTVAGLPLLEFSGAKRVVLNCVEKVTYACATFIYSNSKGLKEIIMQEGFCQSNKIKVIGNGSSNGIDTSYFNPELFPKEQSQLLRTNLGIAADDFVFIFVGRLVTDKGVNELIAAFELLCTANSKDCKLLLVGPFELELDVLLPSTIESISKNNKIINVGFQTDVRPFFACSDCLVFPSYREGFPNVVLQAAVMGLPSIVTDINGCNEIIKEGVNGTIIAVKDIDVLLQAMQKMLDDEVFRTHLSQNARKEIVAYYEQYKVWEAILAEYKNLEAAQPTVSTKPKLIRTATVAISLDILLKGQLAFLNSHYEVVAVSGADAHLETVAKREGVRVVSVPMSRGIAPLKDLVSLVKMYFLFKKEKPHIVHSITPKAGLLSMVAAYFAGVPVRMHTFTGLIFPYKKGVAQSLLLFLDKVLCRFATHIFPEGEGVRNDLQRYKVTTKPLHVLANGNVNGIDTAFFDSSQVSETEKTLLRNELQLTTADFVFVFVGRLVTDKGVNELVAAFAELSKTNTHCKLLLVGPFEDELDPLSAATLQAISNNSAIISVGFQADIRSYLSISNVFVFPSYREGFPNVVLQAGAMGLPCIVTNISGSNEIIQHSTNGLVIPVKDTQSLFKQMDVLLQDKVLTNNLAQSAREIIVAKYQQQLVWEAVLETYKKA